MQLGKEPQRLLSPGTLPQSSRMGTPVPKAWGWKDSVHLEKTLAALPKIHQHPSMGPTEQVPPLWPPARPCPAWDKHGAGDRNSTQSLLLFPSLLG